MSPRTRIEYWLLFAIAGVGLCGAPVVARRQAGSPADASSRASAAISGVVVDASSGAPLSNVAITLRGIPATAPPAGVSTGPNLTGVRGTITDTRGRFVFDGLPAGSNYQVSGSAPGYLPAAVGRDATGGRGPRSIVVDGDDWVSGLTIAMARPGSITGTVVDERGEPVVGVWVRGLGQLIVGGNSQWASAGVATTDDHGSFRLGGLAPGRYIVSVPGQSSTVPAQLPPATNAPGINLGPAIATLTLVDSDDDGTRIAIGRYPVPPPSKDGRVWAYPPTYAPGPPGASDAIDVGYGEERAGIQVRLTPLPASSLAGKLDGPADGLSGLLLRLVPAKMEDFGLGVEVASASVSANGEFRFVNVPIGDYVLLGQGISTELVMSALDQTVGRLPPPPAASFRGFSSNTIESGPLGASVLTQSAGDNLSYFVRQPVTIASAPVTGLVVALRRTATLSGDLIFDGPAPRVFPIRLEPASGRPGGNSLLSDFGPNTPDPTRFKITGLSPTQYVLRTLSSASVVKSILWNGQDYTDAAFDATSGRDIEGVQVTLTNKGASLRGAVRSSSAGPSASTTVLLFPVDRSQWSNFGFSSTRLRSTAVRSDGQYELPNLRAGDYYVVALDRLPSGTWQEPDFLARAAGAATTVLLGWGQTASQDLRAVELP